MMPRFVCDSVKLLPQLTVILMFLFSTSSSKQCRPTTTEKDASIIIRNVGIKLCQAKCVESGQCLSIQYSDDTLTCRLLRSESRKTKTKEGFVSLPRNHPDVPTGSCASRMCSFGQRCLKTRSGQSVCVQDEKNHPDKSPQHKVDREDTIENNPLHEACRKGNLARVGRILSQGLVDINSRDGNHGKTPLMVAAQEGHCRILSCLIRKGANMSQVDNDGKNMLHWACKGGHVGMVECLLPQYGVNINNGYRSPLIQAAFRGYRDVCEFLVCMGANVSQVDDDGDDVLHWGCKGGHLDVVKYLLSLCSLDINSRGLGGKTPLMAAVLLRHTDVCEFLVSRGANVSQVDDGGNNVLHIASKAGRLDFMKSLFSQGSVDINSRGVGGKTLLMAAVMWKHTDVGELLVSMGAKLSQVDDDGNNVLHIASKAGRLDFMKSLLLPIAECGNHLIIILGLVVLCNE